VFTYERKAYVACNFNYLFGNEGLVKVTVKVTASHVHCKCGNVSETVPDRVWSVIDVLLLAVKDLILCVFCSSAMLCEW